MNFRQVTICAAAALLAAAAGCRAHAPACNLPFEMPQVARPAIPSNAVSVADCGGSGGGDAGAGRLRMKEARNVPRLFFAV